jgi:DNA-binding CsgD family transcriptional regulator
VTEPTPRQLWVLAVYVETGGTAATAARLGISPETVRNLLSAARAALRARNTAQAFAIAVQEGLIDPARLAIILAA